MKIQTIITKRSFRKWRSWQLVYEWEDVFRKRMQIPLSFNFDNPVRMIGYKIGKLYGRLPISYLRVRNAFVFEMLPNERLTSHNNSPKVVPCIIDWYLKTDDELEWFFSKYSRHKLIIVTSKEVFEYLSSIHTPIPFGHLPLSISDKYRITSETRFHKDLDVVLMGRQNPVLLAWLNKYCESHPELIVVSSKREKDNYRYYTQEGKYIGSAVTRDECIALLKRSRVGLYSTKGLDGDYSDYKTNGFSQVTPRFFEYLATGNHIIARYPDNADTRYFEMNSICPHTDSYESFEKQMDYDISHPADISFYSEYLMNHYTSTRVSMLENLVKPI